ncbi:MAG: hypothetical protein ACSHX6_10875 [Akkermansiaceae bacterium]
MKNFSLICLMSLCFNGVLCAAEPTESRTWTSVDGKTITAVATVFSDDVVTMLRANGRTVKVPLAMLSAVDQEFVMAHFAEEPDVEEEPVGAKVEGGSGKKVVKAEIGGPESSKDESFYYHYVPSTVKVGGKVSAMFYTGASPGNARNLQLMVPASELTGMVLIACGNSSNKGKVNGTHIHNNLMHAFDKFSFDKERVFFTGGSGGGARAFWNAAHYKYGGAMPMIGYIPDETPPKSGFYYVITGARDYNRYASAFAVDEIGRNATLRIAPGGHGGLGPEPPNDGIIWLYTRNAYSGKATSEEIGAFETRFYKYLTEDLADSPGRAYYWTDHLLNTCKMTGSNKSQFESLHRKLEGDEAVVKYLEGRVAIEKFGEKYLAPIGPGSRMKHTTKEIQKGAAKLLEEYIGVPWVEKVAKQLGEKTS